MKGKSFNQYQIQERGIISSTQLALAFITVVIVTADVFLPAFVAQESGRDSWIAVIIGSATSLIITSIFLTLALRYPEKTIVQYSVDILGKPLGKVIGLVYIYYFTLSAWSITRELGEIFVISFNPDSPIIAYSIIVIAVAAYAVWGGVEVIARLTELLLPLGLGILVLIAFVNIPLIDLKNYLPIMNNGIGPVLRGGFLIQSWIGHTIVLLQVIPFVEDKHKIRKKTALGILALCFALEIGVLTIAVFGEFTAKLYFPALEFVRIARLGSYIENLDVIIMVVWIAGIFLKIAWFYYASVLSIAQFCGLKSYRQLVVPIGVLIICFSIVYAKNIMEVVNGTHYLLPLFNTSLSVIIPVILLIVSFIRHGRSKKDKLKPSSSPRKEASA